MKPEANAVHRIVCANKNGHFFVIRLVACANIQLGFLSVALTRLQIGRRARAAVFTVYLQTDVLITRPQRTCCKRMELHVVHCCRKNEPNQISAQIIQTHDENQGSIQPTLVGKRERTCSVLQLKYDEYLKPLVSVLYRSGKDSRLIELDNFRNYSALYRSGIVSELHMSEILRLIQVWNCFRHMKVWNYFRVIQVWIFPNYAGLELFRNFNGLELFLDLCRFTTPENCFRVIQIWNNFRVIKV